jgi:hypothetical protein
VNVTQPSERWHRNDSAIDIVLDSKWRCTSGVGEPTGVASSEVADMLDTIALRRVAPAVPVCLDEQQFLMEML